MRTNELKAVLAKTNEVAVWPAHIEQELPSYMQQRQNGRLICPTGLMQAKIIETGVTWTERRPVSDCGDQDYEIAHRNGILVELAATADKLKLAVVGKRVYAVAQDGKRSKTAFPHTEVVTRNGHTFIRMIVSHRAIITAWGEYALIRAQRDKDEAEQKAKYKRLYDAQAALMGVESGELRSIPVSLNVDFVEEYEYTKNGEYKRDAQGVRVAKTKHGRIQITVEQAEKIIKLLTPRQRKALASRP